MPEIDKAKLETVMRVLSLLALLLYLAPAAFGTARNRIWLHRAATAILAIGIVVALAASALWFWR